MLRNSRSPLPTWAVLSTPILLLGLAVPIRAQDAPELPRPSPMARVEQRVGVTDFALQYSSPAVKSRKIWGGLVPYDELWRTGANAATKLKVSDDFTFGRAPAATSRATTSPVSP